MRSRSSRTRVSLVAVDEPVVRVAFRLFNHSDSRPRQNYKLAHLRYTSHLADLVPEHKRLADDLANGLSVQLDASTDGQSYLAEVSSDVLSLVRARNNIKLTEHSCLVLKSGSGVNCSP
jgi:hypothetical protein